MMYKSSTTNDAVAWSSAGAFHSRMTTFTSEPEWVDEILDPAKVAIEKQLKRKRWESPAAHNKRLRKLAGRVS